MILDYCESNKKPCYILCTQPRRLSALSIAERVAAERGEKIGQTVGYQIILENRLIYVIAASAILKTLIWSNKAEYVLLKSDLKDLFVCVCICLYVCVCVCM